MCPLSNVKLRVFDRLERHNLKTLLEAGLRVTVNSDDPAYFGGYVVDNYVAAARALDLSREQLATLARNSIEASFLPDEEKRRLAGELRCSKCGKAFVCGNKAGMERCWCQDLPSVETTPGADCLCPDCLRALAFQGKP